MFQAKRGEIRSQGSRTKHQTRGPEVGPTRSRAKKQAEFKPKFRGLRHTIWDVRVEVRNITGTGIAQGLETSKLCSKVQMLKEFLKIRPRTNQQEGLGLSWS